MSDDEFMVDDDEEYDLVCLTRLFSDLCFVHFILFHLYSACLNSYFLKCYSFVWLYFGGSHKIIISIATCEEHRCYDLV